MNLQLSEGLWNGTPVVDFIHCPAWLLVIGISILVEMWELSFLI